MGGDSFPRLYAAASLKHQAAIGKRWKSGPFSAALCRGLIEALELSEHAREHRRRFPRLYAAASLKLLFALCGHCRAFGVFRGFMPRPH